MNFILKRLVITVAIAYGIYLLYGLARLKENLKIRVIYQPVYSLWMSHVERQWQALKDTTTRNHKCRSMWQLLKKFATLSKLLARSPELNMGWKSVAVLVIAI